MEATGQAIEGTVERATDETGWEIEAAFADLDQDDDGQVNRSK